MNDRRRIDLGEQRDPAGQGLAPTEGHPDQAAEQHDDQATCGAGRWRRVLVVDDDPDFLAVAEATLSAHGFRVEQATGGLRGVFLATQDAPEAILCDLRMPGIDGFVVAEALRADPATRHIALFACTSRRDLKARAALRASAFDGVLLKPVDWDALVIRLREAIALRQRDPR